MDEKVSDDVDERTNQRNSILNSEPKRRSNKGINSWPRYKNCLDHRSLKYPCWQANILPEEDENHEKLSG